MEKRWVAADDIGSNNASIIDVMAIVQKIIVEYKNSLIFQNQFRKSLSIGNKINALMPGMTIDRFCPATQKMNMAKNSVAIG